MLARAEGCGHRLERSSFLQTSVVAFRMARVALPV